MSFGRNIGAGFTCGVWLVYLFWGSVSYVCFVFRELGAVYLCSTHLGYHLVTLALESIQDGLQVFKHPPPPSSLLLVLVVFILLFFIKSYRPCFIELRRPK